MADILSFRRKQPDLKETSSVMNANGTEVSQTGRVIEDMACGPWTTRKLKIPTSTSGYLIVECFESADGKRLKGLGKMEPEFSFPNLKIAVQSAFGFDELRLFPIPDNDPFFTETDFMSQVVDYGKRGSLIVILSLMTDGMMSQYKLWF